MFSMTAEMDCEEYKLVAVSLQAQTLLSPYAKRTNLEKGDYEHPIAKASYNKREYIPPKYTPYRYRQQCLVTISRFLVI